LVVFEGGLTNINLDVDDIISAENPLVINLRSKVTEDLIGGVSFELAAHTGYSSATGSVAQPSNVPVDLLNINRQVWHPFSKESSSIAWEQRFIGTTDRSETDFTYTLDVSQQGIHTIIGYRVGFLMEQPPSLSTDAKVSNGYVEDAIDPDIVQFSGVAPATDFSKVTYVEHLQQVATWDFLVDDVVVDTITKEQWDGCKSESRTFLLNTPTLVNSSFTFRMKGSNNELIIALAKIEPIFANDVTYCAKVPYLGNKTCYVHLNDKLLVEDVDYKIVDSRIGDVVVDSQLVVQNKEFLKSSGNKLNILLTRDLTLDKSASLLSGDYLDLNVGTTAHDNSISIIDYDNKFLWFDNLSFMSIDGVLVSNLSDEFAKVMVDSSAYRQGALIGLKTTVPKTSLEYLKESFSSEDRLMMFKVRDYFIADDVATPLPELPQAGTYALYCSTVTWIMKDVLDGEVIPYDPDPRRILSNMPQYKRAFETDVFRSLVLNKNYFTLDPFITDTVSPSDPVVIQLMQGVTL
jgi:hypothetical protein